MAYLVCDDHGVIRELNDEATRLLGYPTEELAGKPLTTILSKAASAFVQTQLYPALAQHQRLEEAYLSVRTKDGASLSVLLNAARIARHGSFENHLAFVSMRRRQLFERELLEAQAAAEQARQAEQAALRRIQAMQVKLTLQERLATIGLLVGSVIHDLSNPLLYTASNLELIDHELRALPSGSASLEDMLNDAREGVAQISKLVHGIRSYMRSDGAPLVPVELSQVIAAAVRMTAHVVKRRAHTEVELSVPSAVVLGDETRLTQVLVNLVLNASQAFEVAAPLENTIRIRLEQDSSQALVQISDNGPGVPPELRQRIFEPFFTTKPVGEGTGLGLAICTQILKSLGGELELKSEPAQGACFRIKLPLAAPNTKD